MFEEEQKKGAKGNKKKQEEIRSKEYFRGLDSLLCGL